MKCDKQGQIGCRKSLQYVSETPFNKTKKKEVRLIIHKGRFGH